MPKSKARIPRLGAALRFAALAIGQACGGSAMAAELHQEPLWEVGAVALGASQQAYPGSSQRVQRGLALPYLIYRGRLLRADQRGAALLAAKGDRVELDIGVAAAFGASSSDIDARAGMPDLGILVEAGPRLKWHLAQSARGTRWRAEFPLRGVFDLNDHMAYKGLAFEPSIVMDRRALSAWNYTASAGAIWADRRLASTFYGVDAAFASAQRPAYEARAGLMLWRLATSVSFAPTADWRLFVFARADSLAGAANKASPLVERRWSTMVGLGASYTFARSRSPAAY